jgi:hypothetical protein
MPTKKPVMLLIRLSPKTATTDTRLRGLQVEAHHDGPVLLRVRLRPVLLLAPQQVLRTIQYAPRPAAHVGDALHIYAYAA